MPANQDGTEQESPLLDWKPTDRQEGYVLFQELRNDHFSASEPIIGFGDIIGGLARQLRAALSANAQRGQELAALEKERDALTEELTSTLNSCAGTLDIAHQQTVAAEAQVVRLKLELAAMENGGSQ